MHVEAEMTGEQQRKLVVEDTLASIAGVLDYKEHAAARQPFDGSRSTTFWSCVARTWQQKPKSYLYFGIELFTLVALVIVTILLRSEYENRCVQAGCAQQSLSEAAPACT